MTHFKPFALALTAVLAFSPAPSAQAIETYSADQQQQYMDWCTGAKSATDSVCSCSLKRLTQSVPPVALATMLSSQGGFSFSAASATTTALAVQAITACAQ